MKYDVSKLIQVYLVLCLLFCDGSCEMQSCVLCFEVGMTIKLFQHAPEHGQEATTLELNSILTFGSTKRKDKLQGDQPIRVLQQAIQIYHCSWAGNVNKGLCLPVETVSVGVKVTGGRK